MLASFLDACAAHIFAAWRGVMSSCCPSGTVFRPPAEFGTPARRAISPPRRGVVNSCCPSGTAFRPPAKFETPVRRAARRGRLWGCAPFAAPLASPPKHPLRGLSNFRRVARATRHLLRELPSLATLAQVISLRAALMPEDAFALNVRPFQPDPPNIIVSFWITFTFFPIALNILTSPLLTNSGSKQISAHIDKLLMAISVQPRPDRKFASQKNLFTIRSWSWRCLP